MTNTNTNTKAFMKKVQTDLITYFEEGKEGLIKQFNHLEKFYSPYDYKVALHMVQGGCFECYYNKVADVMASWFDCTVYDVWKYYKDDKEKLWDAYCYIVSRNIVCIATNTRCYI